jgi:iron complex outermembrane receptor protein
MSRAQSGIAMLFSTVGSLSPFTTVSGQSPTPDAAAGQTETVVVTGARLREESAQEAPVPVTVISGAEIEKLHAATTMGLNALAPNLVVSSGGPTGGGIAAISMRGFITTGADPSIEPGVAVFVDGVYQVINGGSLADIYDAERIEVLPGPQGVLLGKSTGAGAIMLNRSRPTGEFGLETSFEYGSHDLMLARGLLNFPIVDGVLAGKIYASHRERDDYVENVQFPGNDLGGEKRSVYRGALLFTPTDSFTVYLSADHLDDDSSQPGGRNVSGPNDTICRTQNICLPDGERRNVTRANHVDNPNAKESNVTARMDWETGPLTLTSISGYRAYEQVNNVDFDYSPIQFLEVFDQSADLEQLSEEVRLASTSGGGLDLDGRLSWLIGAYYGESTVDELSHQRGNNINTNQAQQTKRRNQAVFGSVEYRLFEKLDVSFGARRNWDDVDHIYSLREVGPVTNPVPNILQTAEFANTSLEGGLRYRATEDKMIYLRYAEGYRAGGFIGRPPSVAAAAGFFPETSVNLELGAKTQWMGGRLLFNIAVFNTEFDDLQRRVSVAGANNTFTQVTRNAAEARTRGVEIQVALQATDNFSVRASAGHLDAEYLRYTSQTAAGELDLSSRPFVYAPKYTARVESNYAVELASLGSAEFNAAYTWTDDYTQSETTDQRFVQPAFGTFDLSARLTTGSEDRFGFELYAKNLFDEEFSVYRSDTGGSSPYIIDDIGRVYGVNVTLRL